MRILVALVFCILLGTRLPGQSFGIDVKRAYPEFVIGVTGITATIEKGRVTTVQSTIPGSPAEGEFEKGDILISVGGRALDTFDPRMPLGTALGAAEA